MQNSHVRASETTGWSRAVREASVDGKRVTHYGLDPSMHFYFRTEDGAIYQRQSEGRWVLITPVIPFDKF